MVSHHPLDPLTSAEITAAASACRLHFSADGTILRFNTITLQEPTKTALVSYDNGAAAAPPRQAFCIIQQLAPALKAFELTIDLDVSPPVISQQKELPENIQPLASPDDCFLAEEIVKADSEVKELLAQRGFTDLSLVACDPWSVHLPPVGLKGRLIQTFMYGRSSPDDNAYAHPIDFVPIVDLNTGKVVQIDKPYGDAAPKIPSLNVNYHRDLIEKPVRESELKPLNIVQPEGPSWQIDGNLITWSKWQFRINFNYREGLVLHNVCYEDEGKMHPVLHRMSLVEMAVPYSDPAEPFTRKCAFDVGDYGLGNCTTSLELGCDCLGHIKYFDAVLNNSKGEPVEIPKAICMHEEDAGVLWKHVEYRNGHSEVRRSRKLVISFCTTVVNYEYLFYISFYQDGTIHYEIKLTGELSTNLLSPGEADPKYGTLVAPGVNSQYHQHMFSARLDWAVDDAEGGKDLVVSEVEVIALPDGQENPAGNGFIAKEIDLEYEHDAQRECHASTGRYWKIKNPNSLNPITGKPVAWKIMPAAGPLLLAKPDSLIAKRGFFATKHLHVTPHSDVEKWPAGDYTMMSEGGEGLAAWTAQNRFCGKGSDPVVWLSFGVTHIPRVEDFPVMPCEVVGFHLKPVNFFTGNPGVDLPATANSASTLATGCCH